MSYACLGRPSELFSELQFQRELHLARSREACGVGNHPEVGRGGCRKAGCIGAIPALDCRVEALREVGSVGYVENLGAELQADSFGHLEGFEK